MGHLLFKSGATLRRSDYLIHDGPPQKKRRGAESFPASIFRAALSLLIYMYVLFEAVSVCVGSVYISGWEIYVVRSVTVAAVALVSLYSFYCPCVNTHPLIHRAGTKGSVGYTLPEPTEGPFQIDILLPAASNFFLIPSRFRRHPGGRQQQPGLTF